MSRAKPKGARPVPAPFAARPTWARHPSTREEADGSIRHRWAAETSERRNLKRVVLGVSGAGRDSVGAVAGGSNPLKRPIRDREGTAWVANGTRVPEVAVEARSAGMEAAGGEDGPGGRVLLRRGRGSEEANPRSAAPVRLRAGARSGEEQGVQGVETPQAQSAGVGSPARREVGRGAQAPLTGRFARLAGAEGERNPMRGGRARRTPGGTRRPARGEHRPTRVMR
jgi:hypothetical protein